MAPSAPPTSIQAAGVNVFLLVRPRLPSLRAQSVALIHAAQALARQGVQVRLPFEPEGRDPLGPYGLDAVPGLHLLPLPSAGTPASLAFRAQALRAVRRGDVLLARDWRYAASIARIPGVRLVVEAHGVPSLLDAAAGRDPEPARRREARALAAARALITNCEGVRDALARLHRLPPTVRVVHNASTPARGPEPDGQGVAYAGSLVPGKDLPTLARAARAIGGVTVLGAHPDGRFHELQALAGGALIRGGPVSPADLPDRLRDFAGLVLPLGTGWFGAELTSPLKAFAYQASGVPFVGADTPALRRAAPGAYVPYRSGDPEDLARAVRSLRDDPALRARVLANARLRTWDQRAAEILEVLRGI